MSDNELVKRLRDMLHELATPVDFGELHPEGRPLWPEEKDSVWDEALVAEAADAIDYKNEALRDCLVWIKADEMFATDFPAEHQILVNKIKDALK